MTTSTNAKPVAMNSTIAALLDLQTFDQKILRLKKKLEKRPQALATFEKEVELKNQQLEEKERSLKDFHVQISLKEDDLQDHESRIQKLQQQQYSPKLTNKEFTALNHEIEGEKANSSYIQDEILQVMTVQEEQEGELESLREEVTATREELEVQRKTVEEEVAKFGQELQSLEAERSGSASGIDRETLSRYERIIQGKGDSALSEVLDNVCQGCYMALTPQMALSVRSGNEIVTCQSCGRLLYLP